MGWRSAHDKHGVKVKVKVGRKRRKISSEGGIEKWTRWKRYFVFIMLDEYETFKKKKH